MLPPGDVALLKSEIARLEKARRDCFDSGIRKVIEARIDDNRKKLLRAASTEGLKSRAAKVGV
jgi:hypothetical protein